MTEILKENDIWEAIRLLNGDTFIYRGGFKEEALIEDVFIDVSRESSRFTNLFLNLVSPVKDSKVRLNRAVIAFAWYVDPDSIIIQELKKHNEH